MAKCKGECNVFTSNVTGMCLDCQAKAAGFSDSELIGVVDYHDKDKPKAFIPQSPEEEEDEWEPERCEDCRAYVDSCTCHDHGPVFGAP